METVTLSKELRRFLRDEMNTIADTMATGGCKSWDEYQKLSGAVHALALVERHLLDLIEKNVIEADD